MKIRKTALLIAASAALLLHAPAFAEETEQMSAVSEISEGLSEEWSDFQFQVNDEIYRFPMMCDEFIAFGWSSEDVEGTELEPYQYSMFRFKRGDDTCTGYLLNLGINTVPASECILAGIDVDRFDWETGGDRIALPGGIVRGEADEAAIEAAYGTPTDVYEGDLYRQLTYELDYNRSLTLYIYKESNVLEDFRLENFVEPEGFDPGEPSEEIPADVAAYERPETLSTDPTDYEIEMDSQVYRLPVPVSVLISDGWELDEGESDGVIAAGYFGWVTLRKGGLEIRQTVVNRESYATIPQNCWIEELEVGGYTLETDGALAGDIRIGMTTEELLGLLEEHGIAYELDDSSETFSYCTYNEKAYDQMCEVMIYTDSDNHFPKDTVIGITCSNAFE